MRRLAQLLVALVALAAPGQALAAEVVLQDHQGRSIRFDVRAEGVDPEWYAALLREAPHGDELSTVRIDVVGPDELASICGRDAGGCYSRNVMVVPAGQDARVAHTLLHEYGHHVDHSRPVTAQREPNGTPEWWRARGMAELERLGSVFRSYIFGWDRSIAEIFAEDYARLALVDTEHRIAWLGPPDEPTIAALLADFGLGPPPAVVNPPVVKPLVITRSGTLAPRRRVVVDFGLLGPGRRVTATATFTGAAEKRVRARLEIRCDGARVALRTLGSGTASVTIDRRDLGPATCTATLASTSATSRSYGLRVRLAVPTRTSA
jgi:hypothetical protein